jgi:hypothetical protein
MLKEESVRMRAVYSQVYLSCTYVYNLNFIFDFSNFFIKKKKKKKKRINRNWLVSRLEYFYIRVNILPNRRRWHCELNVEFFRQ